ncbi:hypothetical protein M441DRAFT_49361 [Trichoderma asperellum CBS 433.97]|uniref:Uncharacterized protein n=1 Tax=Trichoderma asperellum (strain ATCC 204424 / CBS 433.97 / NBRC 101777) TaxID=1042311 RepID=A0A2T3Z2H9_TRIA4|nr:hypothetical protein M441DRAFT_49361 [Trichoderma asperellum CBS 433.97]PTB39005.1 hypothetical protein M441DRAFT_49361 [Trichoderma asperellum CBS 433.97]
MQRDLRSERDFLGSRRKTRKKSVADDTEGLTDDSGCVGTKKRREKRAEVLVAQDAERADGVTARRRRRRQEADSSDGWDRFLISLPRRGAMLMMQEKETGLGGQHGPPGIDWCMLFCYSWRRRFGAITPSQLSRLDERHGRKRAALRPATREQLCSPGQGRPFLLEFSSTVLAGAAITGPRADANGPAGAATAHWVVPYYRRMLHVSTRGRSASYQFRSHPAATRASHAGYMRLALSLNAAKGTDAMFLKFLLHCGRMP